MKIIKPVFKLFCAAGIFALLVASSSAQSETWLFSADSGKQGEAFEIFVQGTGISRVQFSLQNNANTAVSQNDGWRLKESLYVTLMGIPSDLIPGEYKLVAEIRVREIDLRLEKSFRVNEVRFSESNIKLSEKMIRLFDSKAERKKRESIELWTILSSFNPESVFHTGVFILPVISGRSTGRYGDRRNYIHKNGGQTKSIHHGHDFAANQGTLVFSAGRGRVVLAKERLVTGKTVIVEHLPGVQTLYYHLNDIQVIQDEVVQTGTVLGTLGSTGFSTGNHLHWELRVGTVPVNPLTRLSVSLIDMSHLYDRIKDNEK